MGDSKQIKQFSLDDHQGYVNTWVDNAIGYYFENTGQRTQI